MLLRHFEKSYRENLVSSGAILILMSNGIRIGAVSCRKQNLHGRGRQKQCSSFYLVTDNCTCSLLLMKANRFLSMGTLIFVTTVSGLPNILRVFHDIQECSLALWPLHASPSQCDDQLIHDGCEDASGRSLADILGPVRETFISK